MPSALAEAAALPMLARDAVLGWAVVVPAAREVTAADMIVHSQRIDASRNELRMVADSQTRRFLDRDQARLARSQ